MNDFKLSAGIKFDDKYIEAKNKLIDFISALNELEDEQRRKLANEFIASVSISSSFEQFVRYINNGGRF